MTSADLELSVLHGPCAASRLISQLQSDKQFAALYEHGPLRLLLREESGACAQVVAVVVGPEECLECALIPDFKPGEYSLVVAVAHPNVEALSSLAHAAFSKQDAPTMVLGVQPHISQFALLVPPHPVLRQSGMAWAFSRGRMVWSPDDPNSVAAASKPSLPAAATVGAPESRADFEAMARIDAQHGLTNDPLMEERGLEERVQEMAEETAGGHTSVTIAREPGGALVAMVRANESGESASIFVKAMGTLPSHARRGYAAGLLAHALTTKMKRVSLTLMPGNEAAEACYAKPGFVHAAELAGYKYADPDD